MMAYPSTSGTAYTTLASMVQLFGEDGGFNYMKGLHQNISQYTKSGSAGIKAASRGEITIGVVFVHGAVKQAVSGFPIEAVSPCEGTGYEIGSASIIMQLAQVIVPRIERLKSEGQAGRKKINQYTRYLTIGIAIIQSFAIGCLLYTSPSPRDRTRSRMPSSA